MNWCSWPFVSHSIPFVFSQANASLGLVSGAPVVEPKSASIGWVGFFSGPAGAAAGASGVGLGAISSIGRCENLSSLNRILPIFILHRWIKRGRGRPHSIVSLFRPLRGDRFCNTPRTASSKSNIAATQTNGVKSEKLPGKGIALMAYDLFAWRRGQRILPEVCELAEAFVRLPGREF